MKNISLIEEEDRFWNWYQGYSKLSLPHYEKMPGSKLTYTLTTFSSSASYKTQFYGSAFDPEKVYLKVSLEINLNNS